MNIERIRRVINRLKDRGLFSLAYELQYALKDKKIPQEAAPSAQELADARKLLEQLLAPCEGADAHSWRKCKRCAAVHGIEMRFSLSMRLLRALLASHDWVNEIAHADSNESSSLSLRAERVVEEARRHAEMLDEYAYKATMLASFERDQGQRNALLKFASAFQQSAKTIRALLASQEAAAPSAQWRGIATAPKDGTRFIAWGPKLAVAECEWREAWAHYDAGWYRTNQHPVVEPTLWQPLPSPPAQEGSPR